MLDLDQWLSCWIKDVPYVWVQGNTAKECKRLYLVESYQIIHMNTCVGSLEQGQLERLQSLQLIDKNTPVYFIGPTCEWANLFQVYMGDYNNLPVLRTNGKITKKQDIPNQQQYKILAHNQEFGCKILNFETTIRPESRLLNLLYYSHLQKDLMDLIIKRVRGFNYNYLNVLLKTATDQQIYDNFKKSQTHRWGEKFNPNVITGRAQSRIDEFKAHLPMNAHSILDIGAGNCEIVLGFARALNIPRQNIWAVDVDNYAEKNISNWLNFVKVAEGEKLPIQDNSIDLVMLFQSMHHMKDLDLKLREVSRVLKPEGTVFIREHDCRDWLTTALIDVEHALYDAITNVTTDYVGTVYRPKSDWTKLLKMYNIVWVADAPLFAKSNPTKYYNAVFRKKIS